MSPPPGHCPASAIGLSGQIRVSLSPHCVAGTLGKDYLSYGSGCQAVGRSVQSSQELWGKSEASRGEREIETVSKQLRPDGLVETLDPTVSVLVPNFSVLWVNTYPFHLQHFELHFCHLQMKEFYLFCARCWDQDKPISEPKQPSRVVEGVYFLTCIWILAPLLTKHMTDLIQVPLCLDLLI